MGNKICQCSQEKTEIDLEEVNNRHIQQPIQLNSENIQNDNLDSQKQKNNVPENIQDINKKFKNSQNKDGQVYRNIKIKSNIMQNQSGEKVMENFQLGKLIGEGTNSEIFKVRHKISMEIRAMKRVDRNYVSKNIEEKGIIQIQNLKDIDHPNIQKIFEYYQDFKYNYIITEYYEGGDLFQMLLHLDFFSETEAGQIMFQLLSAVSYLHQNGIMHRDIKPEKICFATANQIDQLKLIGFGESTKFSEEINQDELVGTPYYIAPEVLKGSYNEKCDIWSCGVVLATMLTGDQIFNGQTTEDILSQIQNEEINFNSKKWQQVSQEAKQFIKSLLSQDYNKRPSAEQALQNQWLQQMRLQSQKQIDLPNLKNQLQSLQDFKKGQTLSHAIRQFIVDNLVTAEEKKVLLESFQALDTNGDGLLSRQEVLDGYKKIDMENQMTEQTVDNIFQNIDDNQNGNIDFQEFQMAAINQKKIFSAQSLEKAFKFFDDDNNGFITIKELQQIFITQSNQQEFGQKCVWEELIKEFDDNQDGKISLKEFISCIQNKFKNQDNTELNDTNQENQKQNENKITENVQGLDYNIVIHENN